MSKLAHPERVRLEDCLAGLLFLAGQKPRSPWDQKKRSDALGPSKLLQMIWQVQITSLRLILSQREGGLKEGLGPFIRVLLEHACAFPVPLHLILDKSLKILKVGDSCRFMPTSLHASNFQFSGSGLGISATTAV